MDQEQIAIARLRSVLTKIQFGGEYLLVGHCPMCGGRQPRHNPGCEIADVLGYSRQREVGVQIQVAYVYNGQSLFTSDFDTDDLQEALFQASQNRKSLAQAISAQLGTRVREGDIQLTAKRIKVEDAGAILDEPTAAEIEAAEEEDLYEDLEDEEVVD